VAVGLLPTYESIGVWAPILLVITRILQGLGAGAELGGAVTLLAEHAPIHRRAFYTSFTSAAIGASVALSTGSFAILAMLPRNVLLDWAWRVPFLASAVIFFVAIFIRRRIEETPAFLHAYRGAAEVPPLVKVPLFTALQERPRALIVGILCVSGAHVHGFAITTFSLSYIKDTLEMSATVATLGVVAATGFSVMSVPFFGRLSDRFGRRPLLAFGAIFIALYIWLYFALLDIRNPAIVIAAMTLSYGIGQSATNGALSAFLSELYETRYRFTGVTASREINAMLLGGTTPFIATLLVQDAGGTPWLVAVYIAASQLLTLLGLAMAPRPTGRRT
jgi:MFS family permease